MCECVGSGLPVAVGASANAGMTYDVSLRRDGESGRAYILTSIVLDWRHWVGISHDNTYRKAAQPPNNSCSATASSMLERHAWQPLALMLEVASA